MNAPRDMTQPEREAFFEEASDAEGRDVTESLHLQDAIAALPETSRDEVMLEVAERREALDDVVRLSEELGLYDDEPPARERGES